MKSFFSIFKIKLEERSIACVMLVYLLFWHILFINKYVDQFITVHSNYHRLFVSKFHVSGFDPLTYAVVSDWWTEYNIYRHPLLAFFMYLPYQLNQGVIALTGHNGVQFIVGAILLFCAFYAFLFLYRILRELLGLQYLDAILLSVFLYSMAYIMIASVVPDHFIMSMFMLLLTLYVAGVKMVSGKPFTKWQTIILFFVTGGISLNNGIKVFLANFFVNGKKFWKPTNLVFAIMLPAICLWIGSRLEWNYYEKPRFLHRQEMKAIKVKKERTKLLKAFRDTTHIKDTLVQKQAFEHLLAEQQEKKNERKNKKAMFAHQGKPIAHGEFSQWTDITTPRGKSLVENFFGEAIQLHQDHLLEDVLSRRPVIVEYKWVGNYCVEICIFLLFIMGILCAFRERYFWLAFSFFAMDVFIHIVLGFGINEVYIMSPHYLIILPIAIGYLFKRLSGKVLIMIRLLVLTLTIFLLLYNGILFNSYLLR